MEKLSMIDHMITDFSGTVPGVTKVLVVSADGHPLVGSWGSQEDTRHGAAIVTAFVSLGDLCADTLELGECQQLMVEMHHRCLVLMRIGTIACLAVLAGSETDLNLLGTEMTHFTAQLKKELAPRLPTRITGEIGPTDTFHGPDHLPRRKRRPNGFEAA